MKSDHGHGIQAVLVVASPHLTGHDTLGPNINSREKVVLVMDDEIGIAELIDAILTDEGFRGLTAMNRRQGLAIMADDHPDLGIPRLHDAGDGWSRRAARHGS